MMTYPEIRGLVLSALQRMWMSGVMQGLRMLLCLCRAYQDALRVSP